MTARTRLAIVASHPIQYYVPLYRVLAASAELDLHVLYCSRIGLDKTFDPEMGVEIVWNMDLLGGYSHEFLPEARRINRASLLEINNPSVTAALLRAGPEVVIVHGYGMITMLRALAWCRMKRIPAIMTSDSSTHSSGPGARRQLKLAALPLLLRQYSAFLTMSQRGEDYLESLSVPRGKMFRTPMLVPETFWTFRNSRADVRRGMRRELQLADSDLVLLYVGKLYAGKRADAAGRRRKSHAAQAAFAGRFALS